MIITIYDYNCFYWNKFIEAAAAVVVVVKNNNITVIILQ